jgi:hypothetical protein
MNRKFFQSFTVQICNNVLQIGIRFPVLYQDSEQILVIRFVAILYSPPRIHFYGPYILLILEEF